MSTQDLQRTGRHAAQVLASPRLRSLDGLRGLAAVVVVVHHCLLAVPGLAAPYFDQPPAPGEGLLVRALVVTPLHLLWAGGEAVYVFFVLSGLVLALPVLGATRFRWRVYYPQRLVRLYLPVAVAVVFGTALVQLVPREDAAGLGAWLENSSAGAGVLGLARDLTLVAGPSGLITPLWSLQWEVLFSLALPLYLLAVVALRRRPLLAAALVLAAAGAGAVLGRPALTYLPMFALGVLLAVHLRSLRELAERLPSRAWWPVVTVTVLLLTSRWTAVGLGADGRLADATTPVAVAGAGGAVLVAAFCPPVRAALESRPLRWLGLISFSLYLVHEPVVVAVAFLLGPGAGWLVLPVAAPIALPVAVVFFHVVEAPSHRLARRVGAALGPRVVT